MGGPGSGRRKKPIETAVATAMAEPVGAGIPGADLRPLAEAELTDYDKALIQKLRGAISMSQLGINNPMWDDAEEFDFMRAMGKPVRPMYGGDGRLLSFDAGPGVIPTININERFSKRHTVADMNIPRTPIAVIQLSLRYAIDNPFVAKAARVKTNFTVKDFSHKTNHKQAKEFYDDYARRLRLRTQLNKIVFGLYTVGLAPVYWGGENGGPITGIQVLDPRSVHIEEILGHLKMWIRIDEAMIAAVKDPKGLQSPGNKALYDSMPGYWIKAVAEAIKTGNPMGLIELPNDCYTVIENRYMAYNRVGGTLDGVPLQGAFDALQRYRLLSAGDFAVAWMAKNMLTLISEGDPKADPKDYKVADNVRLQKLQAQFSNPDYALTIFCDPTTQVRYVVPPLEVWDPKKYKQVEKEIKEVLNLPSFMWANEGTSTFGAAQAEVQLLRQEVDSIRILLEEQFFIPFYTRLRTGAARIPCAAADIPLPQFDQNSLRDDAIWLQANQEMYTSGAISLETLLESFGYKLEYEAEQKIAEHAKYGNTSSNKPINNTPMRPLFEPSQNNIPGPEKDKGGRPGNSHNEPQGRGRRPRTAGK